VVLAHRMAVESPLVEAEMVEAMEFPSYRPLQRGGYQTTINLGQAPWLAPPRGILVAEIMKVL
jgi:hypothetical protein